MNSSIFISFNIEYDDKNYNTLIHELIHCIFSNKKTASLPTYFKEGVTELLLSEYFTDNPYIETNSYPYEIAMVKILCEMVGSNTVLEAYTTGNMNLIQDKLTNHFEEHEDKNYLKNIELMFNEYAENGNVSFEKMSYFLECSNNYFKNNFNNSDTFAYEYNKEMIILMIKEKPTVEYMLYVMENGYYVKPYFNKKLKEQDINHYQKELKNNPF